MKSLATFAFFMAIAFLTSSVAAGVLMVGANIVGAEAMRESLVGVLIAIIAVGCAVCFCKGALESGIRILRRLG